jgi:thiol-disulfide isomerase/thioredoxin
MSWELEEFLHTYSDLVLVHFQHETCDAGRYMEQLLGRIERFQNMPILHLPFHEHREWAQAHGIYGTPAFIVYYQHQLVFRIVGRVTPEELLQHFADVDLPR